jgi:hypothetical protein
MLYPVHAIGPEPDRDRDRDRSAEHDPQLAAAVVISIGLIITEPVVARPVIARPVAAGPPSSLRHIRTSLASACWTTARGPRRPHQSGAPARSCSPAPAPTLVRSVTVRPHLHVLA